MGSKSSRLKAEGYELPTEYSQLGFAFGAAGHEVVDGFAGGFAVVEDGVHLFGDRHPNTTTLPQPLGSARGQPSFGNHTVHSGDDVGQLPPASQFHADGSIARQPASAGQHKISQP